VSTNTSELAPTSTIALIHQIWPAAVIGSGLVLTAGWICLLGYALFELIAS